MSFSPVPLKTRRVGQRCILICRELKRPPVGVVVRRGVPAKIRGPGWLPKAENRLISAKSSIRSDDCANVIHGSAGCMSSSKNHDEAHFWLNGYVNKQNCRIWSEANPQVYVETPLHPEKLTVGCALWAGRTLLQKR
ncbi:hypothetical protein TNCV_2438781 [Trichonephila clavipes]|nr:hypothetical protein TNCV_2438781 [Trichonephila clavipes]